MTMRMLVVDDDAYFQKHRSIEHWPQAVSRLYVGPSALFRRWIIPAVR